MTTEAADARPPRRISLRRQAFLRLAGVTVLMAVGILLVGLNSFHTRQGREIAQKQAVTTAHYADLLPKVDTDWQEYAQRTRIRIELLRILETDGDARWAKLHSYLTAQGEFNDFPDLMILDAQEQVLFRYGNEAASIANPAPLRAAGWYVAPASNELYRVLATPLWLGKSGQGTLLLLRRLDNATLGDLAIPEVRLLLHVDGRTLAASRPGLAVFGDGRGFRSGLVSDVAPPVIQDSLPWPGQSGAPLLVIQREFIDSYPLPEFLMRPALAIVLVLALILLGLGTWLRRTVRRIESVTAAIEEYRRHGAPALAEQVMAPAHGAGDEVHDVGDALLSLMQSVDARDREQRAYLETLAMLEEAVLELDCDGVIQRASPGWQRLSRRDDAAVGRPLAEFLHPEDVGVLEALYLAFIRGEKEQGQARLRLSGGGAGQDQWVEARFVVRREADGSIGGSRGVLRDVTQTYLHEQQISHMALHDALTDLPNRVLLEDRIKVALLMARRSRNAVGICFIDLDHFKNVNDSLGHKAGDRLLVAFARRVRGLMRSGDTLARWGGDEFVLLLPELTSATDVREVLDKITEAFRAPVKQEDTEFVITFSIGVALFPGDADDVETLLSQADRALFYAKAQGRNQACLFGDIAAKSGGRKELYLQQKLADAVRNERIEAWFQPLIDARSGRCVGAEVLARWHDSEYGWVSPATFIPMAENLGVIRDLGRQIWLQALTAGQAWRAQGHHLRLAVNVSKRQLFSPYIAEQLLGELALHGMTPADVVLEITESVALLDAANTAEHLFALDRLGFRIAVDDFGTGYSSLSQLHELPADELKIDISFVRRINEPSGLSMVQAIIQLAGALNLETVAEGVEDAVTAARLIELGVDYLQGYHYAPPMSRHHFEEWMGAQARS